MAAILPAPSFSAESVPVRDRAIAIECVSLSFNNDAPGQPPQTGGLNQPSELFAEPGTTILVQSTANGISSQPVVLTTSAPSQFATVGTTFPPVSNGTVRVEATVSFDRLIDGFFLQTSVSVSEAVVTRLIVLSDGSVRDDFSRTLLGQYEANTPFRVRMDIDMTVDRWSVALDDELNGFDDDPVISDLPFENPSSVLPSVSVVHASFDVFPVRPIGGSIAYDDIAVLCPDGMTSVSRDTWGSVKLRYR